MKPRIPDKTRETIPQTGYFGTDGIRGRVGQWPIRADFMLKLGRALGKVLLTQQKKSGQRVQVLIGKDTRISGYMFESVLEAGLVAAGVDVRLLGPMPTSAVAYFTRTLGAQASIVISASHNPYHDNGIKIFSANGEKLSGALESAIEREIQAAFTTVASEALGKVQRLGDAITRYVRFCKGTVDKTFQLSGMKIVLDCAHGATYQVAPKVFIELGAELILIGVHPDGFNINHKVGSTHPQTLQQTVLTHGADLGIAFDGDGDRVQMIDRHGVLVDGDDILYLLARQWQRRGLLKGPVVGTVMSNHGLQRALENMGLALIRANVGDRCVLQQLKTHGGMLGGEPSGHILCLDRTSTGDGIIAALAVLEALAHAGEDLSQARQGLHKIPQLMLNVHVSHPHEVVSSGHVRAALTEAQQLLHDRGRVIMRASGTEPLVRVTVEAPEATQVKQMAHKLADVVRHRAWHLQQRTD